MRGWTRPPPARRNKPPTTVGDQQASTMSSTSSTALFFNTCSSIVNAPSRVVRLLSAAHHQALTLCFMGFAHGEAKRRIESIRPSSFCRSDRMLPLHSCTAPCKSAAARRGCRPGSTCWRYRPRCRPRRRPVEAPPPAADTAPPPPHVRRHRASSSPVSAPYLLFLPAKIASGILPAHALPTLSSVRHVVPGFVQRVDTDDMGTGDDAGRGRATPGHAAAGPADSVSLIAIASRTSFGV